MVDCSSRAKVLDLPRIAQGASPRAAFYPEAPAAQFLFRGGQAAAEAAGMAWGIGLPRQACRSAQHGGRTALWLGPDEWLLLSHGDSAEGLENAMAAALGDAPHSVVSVGPVSYTHLLRPLRKSCGTPKRYPSMMPLPASCAADFPRSRNYTPAMTSWRARVRSPKSVRRCGRDARRSCNDFPPSP